MTRAASTRDELIREIARVARVSHEDIQGETDLVALGLRSLDIMRIVNAWRARGLPVTYRDLSRQPTPDAWWALISGLLRANPYLSA